MQNLVEQNLKSLEKRFPGITELIVERKEGLLKKDNLEVCIEEAYTGEPILKVIKDAHSLYLAGKRDPGAHAINQINVLGRIVPYAPVFIIGSGNLHYLEEVLNNTDDSVSVLLYEPIFSIFYRQLEIIDFERIFRNRTIALVVDGINDDGVDSLLKTMLNGDKVPILKQILLPNYEKLANEKTSDFLKKIIEISHRYQVNLATRQLFNRVMADNFYHNVKYVKSGYTAQQLDAVLPKDIPAIIVAAGPSLKKNIEVLKKAKNRAFIIAVDTALKPLHNAGITPDMYAMLDPLKPLALVQTEAGKKTPLISLVTGSKQILDYHEGKKFFVDEGYNYIYELFLMNHKKIAGLSVGGSVATLAFSLVCHLGFKTIVFVGQDLAYTGNKSHIDGTFQEKMPEKDTTDYIWIPGNYEEQVPTITNLNDYRLWFQEFIESWKKMYDVKFINATEGGAKIEGTEVMSLSEVIDKECTREVAIEECIDSLPTMFNDSEQVKIEEFLSNTPKRVHEIVLLARKGKKLYQRLDQMCRKGHIDKTAYVKLLKRIKRNRKEIEKNENYQLLSETMVNAEQIIRSSQYFQYDSIEEEGIELARQGMGYMGLLEEYAGILEKIAEDVFKS